MQYSPFMKTIHTTNPSIHNLHQDSLQSQLFNYDSFAEDLQRQQFIFEHENIPSVQSKPKKQPYQRKTRVQRKTRITITKDKVDSLNFLFQEYKRLKERGQSQRINLKGISQLVNLGYSTIIHKYKEFQESKRVKTGVRVEAHIKKRKYKKSYEIQYLIEEALKKYTFFTAVQISKFIYTHFGMVLSRSVVSRHLAEMGYSFNNLKPYPIQKNQCKYIDIRQKYVDIIQPYLNQKIQMIHIDEVAISLNVFRNNPEYYVASTAQKRNLQNEDDYVSLMIAASSKHVYVHQIKYGFYNQDNFCYALRKIKTQFIKINSAFHKQFILLTDTNKIHYDAQSLQYPSKGIIESTLAQNDIKRMFIPPNSPQLNPLQSIFSVLKSRLSKKRDTIASREILFEMVRRQSALVVSESTQFYFKELNLWIQKARRRQFF